MKVANLQGNDLIKKVLIIGSAPDALVSRDWKIQPFDEIVTINNAWQVRDDWTSNIFPDDFPKSKQAKPNKNQTLLTSKSYVPAQNQYGGFVYAGGTMAFTASYWVLSTFNPTLIAFIGCDMIYDGPKTHFYGKGTADPLRNDITLKNLFAKSARIEAYAALQGCAVVNLSEKKSSKLIFPRVTLNELQTNNLPKPRNLDYKKVFAAKKLEKRLAYFQEDGKYWKKLDHYIPEEIDKLDKLWIEAINI